MTGAVGATVRGMSPGTCTTADATALRAALAEHGVLFFEFESSLESGAFAAFARLFGDIDEKDRQALEQGRDTVIDSETAPMVAYRNNIWHANATALASPPGISLLTPVTLPDVGGDTMWACMATAWDALSDERKHLLERATVIHGIDRKAVIPGSAKFEHPAALIDPASGRRLLYVNANYAERIVGMAPEESEDLLQELFRHINTPEFHVRLRWRPGTVAVWDERRTQHRGVADFAGRRILRRLALTGSRPGV